MKSFASTARDRTAPFASFPKTELQAGRRRALFPGNNQIGSRTRSTSRRSISSEERGVIETPHMPTMRVATPVLCADGKPFGIVIINVDMRPALDRVRSSARPGETYTWSTRRGNYLVHPDRAREFGSQLRQADRLESRLSRSGRGLAGRQASRSVATDQTGRPSGVALARRCWPAANGSASSKPRRTLSSWRRRPASGTASLAGRLDRRAVRGGAGVPGGEVADAPDRPTDGKRWKASPRRAPPSFPSMPAARPACWRAPLRA